MTAGEWVVGTYTVLLSLTWPLLGTLGLARWHFGRVSIPLSKVQRVKLTDLMAEERDAAATGEKIAQVEEKPVAKVLPFEEYRNKNQRHVLDSFAPLLHGKVDTALQSLFSKDGEIVTVSGVVKDVKVFFTKTGHEAMATGVIEDPSGRAEITLYPSTWLAHPLDTNDIVVLQGKVRTGKILVNTLDKIGEIPFDRVS